MNKKIILGMLVAVFLSALTPLASAFSYCANDSYQVTTTNDQITTSFGTRIIGVTSYENCSNTCDMRTGSCRLAEGHGMTMEIYIIIFLLALGMLAYSIKSKHWLLAMFAMVLFAVLAFLGFNLEIITVNGVQSYGISGILVLLTWLLMVIALVVLLLGSISTLKLRKERGAV